MGVMECSRIGCESIMCDRYSHRHGYICNECLEELILLGEDQDISDFMDSYKVEQGDEYGARQKFEEEFPL